MTQLEIILLAQHGAEDHRETKRRIIDLISNRDPETVKQYQTEIANLTDKITLLKEMAQAEVNKR